MKNVKNLFSTLPRVLHHVFYLPDNSPWPIMASSAIFFFTNGMIVFFHENSTSLLYVGITAIIYVIFYWCRDVIRESTIDRDYGYFTRKNLLMGVALFIVSEVMFFVSLFWAYLDAALSPHTFIGNVWPPAGVVPTIWYLNDPVIFLSVNDIFYASPLENISSLNPLTYNGDLDKAIRWLLKQHIKFYFDNKDGFVTPNALPTRVPDKLTEDYLYVPQLAQKIYFPTNLKVDTIIIENFRALLKLVYSDIPVQRGIKMEKFSEMLSKRHFFEGLYASMNCVDLSESSSCGWHRLENFNKFWKGLIELNDERVSLKKLKEDLKGNTYGVNREDLRTYAILIADWLLRFNPKEHVLLYFVLNDITYQNPWSANFALNALRYADGITSECVYYQQYSNAELNLREWCILKKYLEIMEVTNPDYKADFFSKTPAKGYTVKFAHMMNNYNLITHSSSIEWYKEIRYLWGYFLMSIQRGTLENTELGIKMLNKIYSTPFDYYDPAIWIKWRSKIAEHLMICVKNVDVNDPSYPEYCEKWTNKTQCRNVTALTKTTAECKASGGCSIDSIKNEFLPITKVRNFSTDFTAYFLKKYASSFNWAHFPMANTFLLVTSGIFSTLSLAYTKKSYPRYSFLVLLISLTFSLLFTLVQYTEYRHLIFGINDSVFGSSFYLTTGFHGIHVIVGSIWLFVCLARIYLRHFSSNIHVGYTTGNWYWHFVDVVWVFVFLVIYMWTQPAIKLPGVI
jgi:heme/copper-type cytochrome/quinol oxidase subunit 3